jgi:hypothetical protein
MVIGSIIYETVDIVYNVTRIGKNAIFCLYNWYYTDNNENDDIKYPSNKELLLLKNRIKLLENKLLDLDKNNS